MRGDRPLNLWPVIKIHFCGAKSLKWQFLAVLAVYIYIYIIYISLYIYTHARVRALLPCVHASVLGSLVGVQRTDPNSTISLPLNRHNTKTATVSTATTAITTSRHASDAAALAASCDRQSAQQRLTHGQAWSDLMVLKLSIVSI